MIETAPIPVAVRDAARDAARDYLRIAHNDDNAALADLAAAAIVQAEAFTRQLFIVREVREILPVRPDWQCLGRSPVSAIVSADGLPAEGPAFALPPSDYRIDIDANGDGLVRILNGGAAGRVRIDYRAGLAAGWDSLAEPLRLAVLRHAAHGYTHRDRTDDPGPPAAFAALLQPWRRMALA